MGAQAVSSAGAIDVVEGRTRHERFQNVARMTFVDEEGHPHRFTWRTIQTWEARHHRHDRPPPVRQGRLQLQLLQAW